MTEVEFWGSVDEARSNATALEEVVDNLRGTLESMSREDVVAFQRCLNSVMKRAYSWDLIAAACFLGCGQSDDGFEDFRAWLIAQGHETFETVVKDVNSLADVPFHESPTEEWYCEELHLLPGEIGGEEDDPDWPYRCDPEPPHGTETLLTKDELRRCFPRLWDRFGDRFMIGIA
jgi:hypothetical protein